ncbi:GMC oxidoreductase [Amycolatopsis sp. NPDC051758]|uniref:GMC oxidoreductase n=1 Tax=Amycolatopsis sp. NPDC051758 TaxID=3363935 RepID=UPI0037969380
MVELLGAGEAAVVTRVCELLVPGSAAGRPDRYLAATLAGLSAGEEDAVHAAIGVLAGVTDARELSRLAGSAAFERFRRLAIEAGYGDHAPPGRRGPDGADVLVVGLGGAPIAADLAGRGADVLLLDVVPAPARFVSTVDEVVLAGGPGPVAAERAPAADVAKFHQSTGLLGATGPFGPEDLEPWYSRVEARLGPPDSSDRSPAVVEPGFVALGTPLRPRLSWPSIPAPGGARVRTRHGVRHVLLDTAGRRPKVTGVAYTRDGCDGELRAPVVVLAAGPLETPRILVRTGEQAGLDTPSARLAGRTLGLHPARLVYGWFPEPAGCATTACCDSHDGIAVEATVRPEPVAFAEGLVDPRDRPLWGGRLAEVVRGYPHWLGLRVLVADDNTAVADLGLGGEVVVGKRFSTAERRRLAAALEFGVAVLRAAGARDVVWSGLTAAHPQGGAPMGDDPARSVVGPDGRSHDVDGLYVGDGSVLPAVLSVPPALTVLALAAKVAGAIR